MKTSELTGAALDWAVAKLEGDMVPDGGVMIQTWPFYSSDWSQGGPIIEREKIDLRWDVTLENTDGHWIAEWWPDEEDDSRIWGFCSGPTPLIAAMRCYVASKLGDEVEVPL